MPEEIPPRPLAYRYPLFAVPVISSAHPFRTPEIGEHAKRTVIAVSGSIIEHCHNGSVSRAGGHLQRRWNILVSPSLAKWSFEGSA